MAVLLLGPAARMASGEAPPACDIEAVANFSTRRIVGTATFDFHNTSTNSVNELQVVAYPNRYDSDGTEIPHDLFDRVFPSGPSPARLTICAIRADGRPCDVNPAGAQGLGSGVLHAAALPSGVQPGERVSVEMDFETLIPKRFGTFGSHDGTVCLNGGWYPYLTVLRSDGTWDAHAPPPRSAFRVRLTVEDGRGRLFVNDRPFDVAEPGAIVETGTEAGYLTLVYYAESREERILHDAVDVRYVSRHPRPDIARELSEAVARAVEDVRTIRPKIGRPEIVLLEVPLRRDLVMPGQAVVLVSDRIRQVFGPLRDYHFAPLIEAVYARLLTPPRARGGGLARRARNRHLLDAPPRARRRDRVPVGNGGGGLASGEGILEDLQSAIIHGRHLPAPFRVHSVHRRIPRCAPVPVRRRVLRECLRHRSTAGGYPSVQPPDSPRPHPRGKTSRPPGGGSAGEGSSGGGARRRRSRRPGRGGMGTTAGRFSRSVDRSLPRRQLFDRRMDPEPDDQRHDARDGVHPANRRARP